MKYRLLGQTGLEVSEIGFGAWGLGGDAYGRVDDDVSQRAIHRAVESGINFFDTADLYGAGHSEEVLGDALRHCREQVIIATKVGTLPHRGFHMPQDFSPQHIRASIEQSLRRLQTDYVDVYQLHSPDLAAIDMDAAVAALEQLRRNGKVRAYGISARSPADALKVVEEYDFATVQVNFNLIDHRASESGLFHLAKSRHFGIIARTPLCFGYLTGRLSGGENFDPSDHRNNWPAEQLQRWADAPRAFGKLYNGSRSATQLALLFCLAFDPVSTVIPGMMRPDEVDENVGVSALGPLTINELAEIRRIYQERAYYDPMVKQRALAESVVTA